MSRYARPSAGRSSVYSRSKFTNWARYDPQYGEISAVSRQRPEAVLPLPDATSIDLLALPLHQAFERPFDCQDLVTMLERFPREMLVGLRRIALMGGTARQDKSAFQAMWAYGCYDYRNCSIYLFAYPRRRLTWVPGPLTASQIYAYERSGVTKTHGSDGWNYHFTPESLRRFYLWDVLIHEIGHHVDRFNPNSSRARSERFAEWFARRYGFEEKYRGGKS